MASKFLTLYIILVTAINPNFAQEEERLNELLLEQIQDELGENADVSEISEKLNYYSKRPLNLNTANEKELSNLFFLSPQHIDNLISHRTVSGTFVSILELQAVKGFDQQLIERILPFVYVGNVNSFKGMTVRSLFDKDEGMVMIRYGRNLETAQGYTSQEEGKSRYLGDANRYAVRYRWNFDDKIRFALNMEKDAGESFFNNKQRYGFDFYSGHIEVRELNKYVKKVVIGDYALQFGQGLVSWNGLSFGKGAWIGSVARQGSGLVAYSSMNENNFQRGIASVLQRKAMVWTPFVAYNRISGEVEEDVEGRRFINTINLSGLHRTPTEQSHRHTIGQLVYGSNLSYRLQRLRVGLTYMGMSYDGTKLKGAHLRQKFEFEGKSLQIMGIHYNYSFRNYYIFGETAYSFGGGWATNNGAIASLSPKLSLFVDYRNYRRDYHTIYGQSISEGSQLMNEKGVYTGLVYHPNRRIEWVNYLDIFQFPWLRYRIDAPSGGKDFLSQFTYTWYKVGKLIFRYRYRIKQENFLLDERSTNVLADIIRHQFRMDFQYKLSSQWRIRSRGELMHFKKEIVSNSAGFLLYQDAFWQIRNSKIQLNARLAYFDTDGYDARIYAYENDILYAAGFPMYYEKGIRSYLNARYKIKKNVDVWARYALTYYFDRNHIGSGLDQISGSKKSDIKLQLRWQW